MFIVNNIFIPTKHSKMMLKWTFQFINEMNVSTLQVIRMFSIVFLYFEFFQYFTEACLK